MELNEYIKRTRMDRASAYFVARKYSFLRRYLKNGSGKKKSLDIGSNLGLFSELLKKKGYDSYGLEIDKKKVEWAKKNCSAKYIHGSAEKIPFKDNNFDIIIMFDTLEHIIDRSKALNEVNRVLKPNGIAIITVPNIWSYFYFRSFVTYTLRGMKPWKNVHYQQNYFFWEHQINQFLKIVDRRPILTIPFFEPKLMPKKMLSGFEFNKKNLAPLSAEPIIICIKREKRVGDNTDTTIVGR
jgi:ubiquinone/menaquinone biosynthesis C-methylase UbiE